MKPSKGIEYLQENRLLSKPTDPMEVNRENTETRIYLFILVPLKEKRKKNS